MNTRTAHLLLCALLAACSDGGGAGSPLSDSNPYAGYTSSLYEGQENWLCRPDISDERNICAGDLSTTVVYADGTTRLEEEPAVTDAAVDCFYIYPTFSTDEGDNSDLIPGTAETNITLVQAARYRSVCRVFAPVYRQLTISALAAGKLGDNEVSDKAYADVVDAFKHYIANAAGRGFILIGHSQGTVHLTRLIREEIEDNGFLASRMIAAHLIGVPVALPNDADVGAALKSTPPCNFDNDIHCFVNYSSFLASVPPQEETAIFGVTDSPQTRATCTHPVDLGGGRLNLDSYFSRSQLKPFSDPARNDSIATRFVKVPGLVQGECIETEGKGYLAISVDAEPADPRTDDIGNRFLNGWGLHLIDVQLALGDLVALAHRQAAAWLDE